MDEFSFGTSQYDKGSDTSNFWRVNNPADTKASFRRRKDVFPSRLEDALF